MSEDKKKSKVLNESLSEEFFLLTGKHLKKTVVPTNVTVNKEGIVVIKKEKRRKKTSS
ncbi:MAG: hypothetical protein K0U66_03935 [Gammaproteobacteria bacterium]|nr:hypothetical protein [Gammaproteobacteria bacterium]